MLLVGAPLDVFGKVPTNDVMTVVQPAINQDLIDAVNAQLETVSDICPFS